MQSTVKNVSKAVENTVSTAKKNISTAVNSTAKKVADTVNNTKSTVKAAASSVASTVKKAAISTVKAAKSTAITVSQNVKSTVKNVASNVSKTATNIGKSIDKSIDVASEQLKKIDTKKVLDGFQTGLDLAGMIPGVGEIADGANAAIYLSRGDKLNAGLSAAACIPIIGSFGTGGKLVNKGIKVAGAIADGVKIADNVSDTARVVNNASEITKNIAKYKKVVNESSGVMSKIVDSVDDVKGGLDDVATKAKPYTNSRPSYGKGQVDEVWNNAKDPITGKVYDPTGVEIKWDPTKPRNGQWDMGHVPGEKYSDMQKLYMDGTISKQEFLKWYKNPSNYRPELPSTNRGHKFE